MITYAAGLRLSESSGLKITAIDSKRMRQRVEQGTRSKDRYTIRKGHIVVSRRYGRFSLQPNNVPGERSQ